MTQNFENKVSSLTDRQLEDHIEKRFKFSPESVEAAIAELEKRGRIFSFAELRAIDKDLGELRRGRNLQAEEQAYWDGSVGNSSVFAKEGELPILYSPLAITLFCLIFFPFGIGMMAINLGKSETKKGVWEVIFFGLSYYIFRAILFRILLTSSLIGNNILMVELLFNGIAAMILILFFWNRYIGSATKYQARSIWIPLGIYLGIIVVIACLLVAKFGPNIGDVQEGLQKMMSTTKSR